MRPFLIFLFMVVVSLTCGSAETPQPETRSDTFVKARDQSTQGRFHSYIAHLDSRPEAQLDGWSYPIYLMEDEFKQIQSRYLSSAFEYWKERFRLIRRGMTIKDIEDILKPKNGNGLSICFGSGIYTYIELDEAYYTYGHFSYDGKLMDFSVNPLAITYTVTRGVLSPQKK